MKKILLFLFMSFFINACSYDLSRREIDEINLILVLGIDYSEKGYTLSALFNIEGGSDSGSSFGAVIKSLGRTPYEAYEKLKQKSTKSISIAHAAYYLIGEKAAKNGANDCFDFLSRDETIKMDALFYITKGSSAEAFIKKGIENNLSINKELEAIRQKQQERIKRCDNTLVNILNEMDQSYSSLLIPYLMPDESSFLIGGYAVFDNYKLEDYLDSDTSDGVDFVKNIILRYPIYLSEKASLMLYHANTRLDSNIKNGVVVITIEMDFETMIKEINTNSDIFKLNQLCDLTKEQNLYVKKLIEKAFNYSKTTGFDILRVSRIVSNKNSDKWKSLKTDWMNTVSNIEYEYIFNSKITKSFILGNER